MIQYNTGILQETDSNNVQERLAMHKESIRSWCSESPFGHEDTALTSNPSAHPHWI